MRHFFVGAAVSAGLFLQCESFPSYCYGDACPPDTNQAEAGVPDGCNAEADSKDSPACLDDSFAIFIDSNNGDDAAAGTKEAPVKTITHALTLLGDKHRIYICGTGTLTEHVSLTSAVSLYGGFVCSNWEYNGRTPTIKPLDAGVALKISSGSSPITISDLAFEAQAGATAGGSSIAVFASNSTDVTFRRCSLTAQAGALGSAGINGVDGAWSDPVGGGAGMTCSCTTGGSTTGGAGGDIGASGKDGLPSIAGNGSGNDGLAGIGGVGCTDGEPPKNGSGHKGGNAPSGANAAVNPSLGQLTASGWLPGDGLDGTDGQPGQGGGGGGGRDGAGGGGGCGGCGGTKGTAGQGGGASVALLSFQSTVQLIGCTLTTNQAGYGGYGGNGGDASKGANGAGALTGCPGGDGGYGGAGGAGSGGAGGISAGVLYSGTAPTPDTETTFAASVANPEGQYGAAGKSGAPSVAAGNPGLSGLSGSMVSADDWTVTP